MLVKVRLYTRLKFNWVRLSRVDYVKVRSGEEFTRLGESSQFCGR